MSSSNAVTETPVLKTLKFGIEIETVGLSRDGLTRAIAAAIPGSRIGMDGVTVIDTTGRSWKVVPDGSLSDRYASGEVVSPVLTYDDLDTLQEIVRKIRAAGANVDSSCGIHVHVDGSRFDAKSVVNLVKLVHRHEGLLTHVLGVSQARLDRYCRPVNPSFVARLETRRPKTLADVNAAWYGEHQAYPSRYDHSRYHGLNLNSLFYRGTVEFRYFAGTLHAGKVKANVQLALALAARALTSKAASGKVKAFDPATARYTSRIFLKLLGLTGAEFKTVRHHMTSHLAGSCNFRGLGREARDAIRAAQAPVEQPASPTSTEEPSDV